VFEEQTSSIMGTRIKISSTQGTQNCVPGTNLIYPRNKNIVSGEQISSSIWNKNCIRGTNLINTGNKNIATRNTSFLTPGTRILLLRNASRLLKEQDYYIEEQIVCTKKTRILRLRNKSRLLREQEYCVQGTNLVDTRKKKLCLRNKAPLSWEQE
jgi:hypothetical protein